MRVIVPPLKSQGIKTKLVPWIQDVVPTANGRWIEPFLGTGVVAFNSGFSSAILSDTNPHIVSFYRSVQSGSITPSRVRAYLEREGELLRSAGRNGYDHFNCVRDRFNKNHDPLDFLFLSRAGFNGMMRFNRKGEWNIPFCKKPNRFSRAYITKIVNQVSDITFAISRAWKFLHAPFEEVIPQATKNDIIYCDPPYAGRYADYYNGWDEKDEARLFELLSSTKAKFILSSWHHNDFRRNEMIDRYWNAFNVVTRDHFYHSGGKIENRRSIVEALIFNFPANLQQHNHVSRIKTGQLELLEPNTEPTAARLTTTA